MANPEAPDFIPCLTFVKRGVAKARPEKMKATKEELKEIIKEMKLKEAEFNSRPKEEGDVEMQEEKDSDAEIDDYYDMDNYDDEPTDTASSIPVESLLLQDDDESGSDDDNDSEDEPGEFAVQSTDNLILVGHVDDDVCMLEVYVFNNDRAELFILHDIFLPSYPISIEWLDFDCKNTENAGHFAAIGTMTPQIDIWDLNVTGCLEPYVSLGGKKSKGIKHKDAVIDLAWNTVNRNILASGSADHTVVLWNLADQKPLSKLSVFEEKVQSIKWHPVESNNLLAGSCEGKVRLFDCRSTSTFKTWAFDGEIEKVLWNKFDPLYFFATNDKGMVHYVDIRNPKPVWNLRAHDKEVTGIALSSHCQDLLLTGSMDEMVKVWDLKDQKPQFVVNKSMDIGTIYSLGSCPDVPYVFCAGGSKKDNAMYLWDIRENETVVERFNDRALESTAATPPGQEISSNPLARDGRIRQKNKVVEALQSEPDEADMNDEPSTSSQTTSSNSKAKNKKAQK